MPFPIVIVDGNAPPATIDPTGNGLPVEVSATGVGLPLVLVNSGGFPINVVGGALPSNSPPTSYTQHAQETGSYTVSYWPMNDASGASTLADLVGGNPATILGTVTLGQTGQIPAEADTAAVVAGSGAARIASATALDNDGTLPMSLAMIATPNVLRSGSSLNYALMSKCTRVSPFPGWEWTLRWDGTSKTTLQAQISNANTTNQIDVRSVEDVPNAAAVHLGMSYDGSKTLAGVKFYMNGFPLTSSSVRNNLTGSSSSTAQAAIAARHDGTTAQFPANDKREKLSWHSAVLPQWWFARGAALAAGRTPIADPVAPVNLIIDTDIQTDPGDASAIGIAAALHRSGKAVLRSVVVSSLNTYGAPCVEAILNWCGVPGVLIGSRQGGTDAGSSFTQTVASEFGYGAKRRTDYFDAVQTYRSVLAQLPDGAGVTIACIGGLTSISALMQSAGDRYDPRGGLALMTAKGVRLVAQLFRFPAGQEYNAALDTTATDYVVTNWTGELVVLPYEVGNPVTNTPPTTTPANPFKRSYEVYGAASRPSWDEMTVQHAVLGRDNGIFEYALQKGSLASATGTGTFSFAPTGNRSCLALRASAATASARVTELLGQVATSQTAMLDADALALFARMTTQPDATRKSLVSERIVAAKQKTFWWALDALWVHRAHHSQAARLNWLVNQYDCQPVNNPVFTVDSGYAGDGSTSYLDTQFNPATASNPKFQQNSGSLGIRSNTDNQAAGSLAGFYDGAKGVTINPRNGSNAATTRLNSSAFSTITAQTSSIGMFAANRVDSANIRTFKDGALLKTEAVASSTPANGNFRLGSISNSSYRACEFSMGFCGAGLTDQEAADLDTWFDVYLAAVGT